MSDRSHSQSSRATLGTVALLAAFVIVLLQAIGSGNAQWPNLLAVVLAVLGSGLRIEAVLARR